MMEYLFISKERSSKWTGEGSN